MLQLMHNESTQNLLRRHRRRKEGYKRRDALECLVHGPLIWETNQFKFSQYYALMQYTKDTKVTLRNETQ